MSKLLTLASVLASLTSTAEALLPLECNCQLLQDEALCAKFAAVERQLCAKPYASYAEEPTNFYEQVSLAFAIYRAVCRPSLAQHEALTASPDVVESLFGQGHFGLAAKLSVIATKASGRWHQRRGGAAPNFNFEVFDGIFPEHVVRAVAREGSSLSFCDRLKAASLGLGSHIAEHIGIKHVLSNTLLMGPATRLLMSFLQTQAFVTFLQELTGILGLIPDPAQQGSGLHITERHGRLRLHADFNHLSSGLQRRVNVLLYLNEDWSPAYGGHLEFWRGEDSRTLSKELLGMKPGPPVTLVGQVAQVGNFKAKQLRCISKIFPSLGRLVVFEASDFSYHGHPHPLTCPEDRSRISIAMYYYTVGRPLGQVAHAARRPSNSTLWVDVICSSAQDPRCYDGVQLIL